MFVPAGKITGRRPYGEFGAPLMTAALHFAPVAAATYHGIAAGARDKALAANPTQYRQVGLMEAKLRTSWWSLMGAITDLGEDYTVDAQAFAMLMLAKRQAVLAAREVVDLAMDLMGGRSFFRKAGMERAFRDVRAGTFHPLNPEATLTYAGKVALGDPGLTQ